MEMSSSRSRRSRCMFGSAERFAACASDRSHARSKSSSALILRCRFATGRAESDLNQCPDGGVAGGRRKLAAPPTVDGRNSAVFEPDDFYMGVIL